MIDGWRAEAVLRSPINSTPTPNPNPLAIEPTVHPRARTVHDDNVNHTQRPRTRLNGVKARRGRAGGRAIIATMMRRLVVSGKQVSAEPPSGQV